jgi:Tol biopolymer transport system component
LGGRLPALPQWSPDGQNITFWSEQDGRVDVYVVSANGGMARRVATPAGGKFPFWSRDGKFIYFGSVDGQIWKAGLTGGRTTQITRNRGDVPKASPDGKFVYFLRRSEHEFGVWQIPVNGGDETKVVDSVREWAVGSKALYYFTPPDERGNSELRAYEFADRHSRKILTIAAGIYYGMALSPDGRTLLYSQIDEAGSDLMLVENFR